MTEKTRKKLEQALERIRKSNPAGRLTPNDVVEKARDPKSPLHGHFTWDDSKAAHERRIDQARSLIRSVIVNVVTETRKMTVPVYVRDPRAPADEQGYARTAEIKSERQLAIESLRYELDRALGIMDRVLDLGTEYGLAEQVEEMIGRLKLFRDNVAA